MVRAIDCGVNVTLGFERCSREAQALDLREGPLDEYLHAHAERLFFAPRKPRA